MTQINDTCPGCDTDLTINEWKIKDDELHCPDCGWSQTHGSSNASISESGGKDDG